MRRKWANRLMGLFARCYMCGEYLPDPDGRGRPAHSCKTDAFRLGAATLVESMALAMADAEGNEDAMLNALRTNYDALGYQRLAAAALSELERLGLFTGTSTADAPAGTTSEPRSDLASIPGRGVSAT